MQDTQVFLVCDRAHACARTGIACPHRDRPYGCVPVGAARLQVSVGGGAMSTLDLPIEVTFFENYAAATKTEEYLTLSNLAERIRDTSAPRKDALPWLKLARFRQQSHQQGKPPARCERDRDQRHRGRLRRRARRS